jgi:CRP-like cAMP-binding protein
MEKVSIDKNTIVSVLNKTILFNGINKKYVNKIASLIKCYKFIKGEKIVTEQYKGQDIYVVISGKIEVYFEQNKKRFIIKELTKGDVFGEIGFFIKHRAASCEAVERSVVGVIRNKDFKKLISKDILLKIINLLITRLLQTDVEIKDLVFKSVLQRVCKEIITNIDQNNIMKINIKTLAQKVASSRETVSRMLTLLEKIGAVQRKNNKIVVVDKNKLEKFIQE